MYTKRTLSPALAKSRKSVLLLGPRQTGKSTLIQELSPSLSINLADEETFVAHLSDPGLLSKKIGNHKTIFIDEIQRIPSLLNTIQAKIDENRNLKFF